MKIHFKYTADSREVVEIVISYPYERIIIFSKVPLYTTKRLVRDVYVVSTPVSADLLSALNKLTL